MFTILRNHESHILGVTRVLLGVMLGCHGAQKLLGAFGGTSPWLSLYFSARRPGAWALDNSRSRVPARLARAD